MQTIKRLLRDLIAYAKNNPMKMFMLVVMPLITGGALQTLLKGVGLRLPAGLAGMMGQGARGAGMGAGAGAGLGGLGGMAEGLGGVQGIMSIAKMFI